MIALYILAVLWVLLVAVAFAFARLAGETKWWDFIIVNCVPIAGALLSIYLYSINIGQKQNDERN